MNSIKARAIRDFETGRITAREFGKILARITIRKGATIRRTATRKNARWA